MADESARPPTDASSTADRRLWMFAHYAQAPDRPAGLHHFSLARDLVTRGWKVTIFAAGFGHTTGQEQRVHGRRLTASRFFDGVRFIWLRTWPYRRNDVNRMLNMASYAVLVTLVQGVHRRPDVIIGSTVHPFAALAGWLAARLRGARFIFEIGDFWPQTLIDLGAMSPNGPGARLLYWIEAFLVRRAEVVLSVLPGTARYLEDRGLPSAHVVYLPNGVDVGRSDALRDGAALDPLVAALCAEQRNRRERGTVVLAYTGSHGYVNRLEIVLRAFDMAAKRSAVPMSLLLVGDGAEKPALRELAAELQLADVTFADPIPADAMPALLSSVDVGVIHTRYTPLYRYGVAFNKMYDYMAARLPIAFACDTWADPVAGAGAGITVPPDDPEALAEAFVRLAESRDDRERMGAAGRAFLEREHDMAQIAAKLAAVLDRPATD